MAAKALAQLSQISARLKLTPALPLDGVPRVCWSSRRPPTAALCSTPCQLGSGLCSQRLLQKQILFSISEYLFGLKPPLQLLLVLVLPPVLTPLVSWAHQFPVTSLTFSPAWAPAVGLSTRHPPLLSPASPSLQAGSNELALP